jgi:hypothetical protein
MVMTVTGLTLNIPWKWKVTPYNLVPPLPKSRGLYKLDVFLAFNSTFSPALKSDIDLRTPEHNQKYNRPCLPAPLHIHNDGTTDSVLFR